MSSFAEHFQAAAHALLTLSQDPRMRIADYDAQTGDGEAQTVALKADLLCEAATLIDQHFHRALEQAGSTSFLYVQDKLYDDAVGIIAATVDDYHAAPLRAAIGEWEATGRAGWADRIHDERRDFWR